MSGRLALLALLAAAAPAFPADLQTLTGKRISGEVAAIDAKGITLRTEGGEVVVPLKEALLLDLGGKPAPPKDAYIDVELTDGSLLHCTAFAIKGKTAVLTLYAPEGAGERTVEVPFTSLFYVVRDAGTLRGRADWQKLLAGRGNRDILVVERAGRLDGLEGTAGEGSPDGDALAFVLASGKEVNIKLARVQGLIFNQPPQGNVAPTLCKVTDAGGNLYAARELALARGRLALTTVGGLKVELPDLKQVAKLDFSQGKLTYLSDLDPVEAQETPREDFGASYRRDTNLDGDAPIRMAGEAYAKGLSLHPRTVLAYDIGGEYKELKFVLGVDDACITDSQVVVIVEGDNREIYKAEVRRKEPPRPVTLNVKGVKNLRIIVDSPTLLHTGNQVSLADAKVSK
ncbi:MAG TPA: NPCBM/NEW2 domain-containing protein [Gemmataceae bacterium]